MVVRFVRAGVSSERTPPDPLPLTRDGADEGDLSMQCNQNR